MELAKVEGTIVSTAKAEKLQGYKLLLLNLIGPDIKPTGSYVVAVDAVGAGEGEIVIVCRGSSARQAEKLTTVPTDASIIGIVDTVEYKGEVVFQKHKKQS
jgi:microcompartment protein CcmK/EutM